MFIAVSMLFVLAFPTIANAMTGYSGNTQAFVALFETKSLADYSQFSPAAYMIHDGNHVNLTKDYVVVYAPDRRLTPHSHIMFPRFLSIHIELLG